MMVNNANQYHPGAGLCRDVSRALLAAIILVILGGTVSAVMPETTPLRTGGNIFFESSPTGATIWLDGKKIGTTPFTYFSEQNGTLQVVAQKRLFEDYSGTVTVEDGQRVVFRALMTQSPGAVIEGGSEAVVITTATIPERASPITIPTPWPSPTAESPLDPAMGIGAVALCIALCIIRRRK